MPSLAEGLFLPGVINFHNELIAGARGNQIKIGNQKKERNVLKYEVNHDLV